MGLDHSEIQNQISLNFVSLHNTFKTSQVIHAVPWYVGGGGGGGEVHVGLSNQSYYTRVAKDYS